jgi:hypothetical protein
VHRSRHLDPRAAKRRDIARSLLPSTRRRGARWLLTSIRRQHRRAEAAALRAHRGERIPASTSGRDGGDGALFVAEALDVSLPGSPMAEIHLAVSLRRVTDKEAPLRRWAEHEVAGMATDEARAHLRSVLRKGVVGDHAIAHLEEDLLWDTSVWMLSNLIRPHRPVPDLRRPARAIGGWAIQSGHHAELNAEMRRLWSDVMVRRGADAHDGRRRPDLRWVVSERQGAWLLHGLHDLDRWVEQTAADAAGRSPRAGGRDVPPPYRQLRGLAPIAHWASHVGFDMRRLT